MESDYATDNSEFGNQQERRQKTKSLIFLLKRTLLNF